MSKLFAAFLLLLALTPFATAAEPNASSVVPRKTNVAKEVLRALPLLTPKTPEMPEKDSPLHMQDVVPQTHFARDIRLRVFRLLKNEIPLASSNDGAQYIVATVLENSGFEIDKAAYADIGRAINPNQQGSTEEAIEAFLNKFYRCVIHRNADHKLLVEHLQKGLPALALMQGIPNTRQCVIVKGCTLRTDGTVAAWVLIGNRKTHYEFPHWLFIKTWECRDSGPEVKNTCMLMYPKKGYKPPPKPPLVSAPPDTSSVAPAKQEVDEDILRVFGLDSPEVLEAPAKAAPLQTQKVVPKPHFWSTTNLALSAGPDADMRVGWTNDCGQYTVATLLRSSGYTIDKAAYAQIGRAINPQQTGSSVENMEAFLNKFYRCVTHRNADHTLLVEHLQKGLPALAIVQPIANTRHWVIVTGCTHRPDGNLSSWKLSDNGAVRATCSHSRFIDRWACRDSIPEVKNTCLLIYPKKGKATTSRPAPITAEQAIQSRIVTAPTWTFGHPSSLPRRRDK